MSKETAPAKIKTIVKTKIILIMLGLFLSLIILELGIRAGGFIFLSLQEHRNKVSIRQKSTYKIMCLGESITAGQYPLFLEEILNHRDVGVKFSVIDRGLVNINTMTILSNLEANLDKYQPDMVVTMMGCNDKEVGYYQDMIEADTWIFRHSRLYRFVRSVYTDILIKIKKEGIYGLNRSDSGKKGNLENIGTVTEETSPLNKGFFKKAIGLNSENDETYVRLGLTYQERGKLSQAEDSFKKALELNPKNDDAYVRLGEFYRDNGNPKQIENSLKKALELNPKNDNAYVGLGWFYEKQNKYSQAEDSLKKAIGLNPENDEAYFRLGMIYLNQGKVTQSEDLLKKAIELNLRNDRAYGAILVLYEEMGKPRLAKEYAEKANRSGAWYCSPLTVNNYRKLKEILDQRGIRLVCAQYPMRNIEPLKNIFDKGEGVIFVDNEVVFKEAVKKSGFKEVFLDMSGGDFGHCTEKGNRLLAANIADVILKEAFHK